MGYHRAGFDVIGVDIASQRHYPFGFVRSDAMTFPLDGFDAIHASPPCQAYAKVTSWRGAQGDHQDLLPAVRRRLLRWGGPWIIENVPEAPIRPDYLLCGTQFGLPIRRHRAFETSGWHPYALMPPCNCRRPDLLPFMHKGERAFADAMGCKWMTNREAREAIPPAYTEHIGIQLMAALSEPSAFRDYARRTGW